jgi:hypothetical protein
MKKNILKSLLTLGLIILTLPTFAANIQNISATPDGDFFEFSWEKIPNDQIDQETHYALQWSDDLNKIKINETISATTSMANDHYRMLGSTIFDKNKDYYARVYTYYREERQNILLNGSKILKFKWLFGGNIETSLIEPNDPTVVGNDAATTEAQEFNHLATIPYDTSVQLTWSNVNEIFDKYAFILSENSDLSNPIAELEVSTNYKKALLTNLEPNKKYHIAGYLKRNGRKFGKGSTITFTTLPKFDTSKKRRFDKYILKRKRYGKLLDSGISINDTTTETISKPIATPTTDSAIKARIKELKKLIYKYQSELRKLEAKTTKFAKKTFTSSLKSRLRNWRSRR